MQYEASDKSICRLHTHTEAAAGRRAAHARGPGAAPAAARGRQGHLGAQGGPEQPKNGQRHVFVFLVSFSFQCVSIWSYKSRIYLDYPIFHFVSLFAVSSSGTFIFIYSFFIYNLYYCLFPDK